MTYSINKINECIYKKINGINIQKIEEHTLVSRQTLYYWFTHLYKSNIENKVLVSKDEYLKNKKINKSNKRSLYQNDIIKYIESNKGCSINEIYLYLKQEISVSLICKIIKASGYTHNSLEQNSITH